MAYNLDVKLVVKHLANGSFGEHLCRVCLSPLTEFCENIFTHICKEGKEYCIADVLKELCDIKVSDSDHYNVCPQCFTAASNAYKFYLNAKANDEVLHYYVEELDRHINSVDVPDNIKAESLCVSLPEVTIDYFDYDVKDLEKLPTQESVKEIVKVKREASKPITKINNSNEIKKIKQEQEDDDEIVIVMNENGEPSFFKLLPDGSLVKRQFDERCQKAFDAIPKEDTAKKSRRKREPMTTKKCPHCPITYRFIAKLKEHMRTDHRIILYACKICEALTEDLEEFEFHLKTHTNTYECDICNVTFKKRVAMIDHLNEHIETGNGAMLKSDFVCVTCGFITTDEETLRTHTDLKHYKKHACFYCGRTYKVIASLEKHIKKHEMYLKKDANRKLGKHAAVEEAPARAPAPALTCELCGCAFRGERALLWHSRLHTMERPFTCQVCDRGFVSANRRNQHALTAHTAPARRCPLCPALFHLRSMVNTHIKKVHLKKHKRRTRTVRQQAAHWPTAPVPVQELSVALQARILELQAAARPGSLPVPQDLQQTESSPSRGFLPYISDDA